MTEVTKYNFDELLEELGDLEEVAQRALKKGVAEAARAQMRRKNITKLRLSESMKTSRTQLDRILDQDDTSITIATLVKLARALELEAVVMLRPKDHRARQFYAREAMLRVVEPVENEECDVPSVEPCAYSDGVAVPDYVGEVSVA
jgi:antitoxin HicB